MYVTSAVVLLSHALSDTTITYSTATASISIIVKFTRQNWQKIQIRYALIRNKLDIKLEVVINYTTYWTIRNNCILSHFIFGKAAIFTLKQFLACRVQNIL